MHHINTMTRGHKYIALFQGDPSQNGWEQEQVPVKSIFCAFAHMHLFAYA